MQGQNWLTLDQLAVKDENNGKKHTQIRDEQEDLNHPGYFLHSKYPYCRPLCLRPSSDCWTGNTKVSYPTVRRTLVQLKLESPKSPNRRDSPLAIPFLMSFEPGNRNPDLSNDFRQCYMVGVASRLFQSIHFPHQRGKGRKRASSADFLQRMSESSNFPRSMDALRI